MHATATIPNPLDGLYHQAFGIPAQFLEAVCKHFQLLAGCGSHARQALVNDRYLSEAVQAGREVHPGHFNAPDLLPSSVTVQPSQVVEVEVAGGAPVKVVVRAPATPGFDIVLALGLRGPTSAFIKTLWLNRKSDTHKTLNAAAYRKP